MADVYERARPEYPADAVAWIADELDLGPGRTVLDLGAGTGKLTRALVPTGAEVIAVEPGDADAEPSCARAVPAVEPLLGAAEAIPLADDSVDAVTVGQAFHWFRHDEALPEIHRVLRPGGGIALIWNCARPGRPSCSARSATLIAPFVPPERGSRRWTGSSRSRRARSSARSRSGEFRFAQRARCGRLVERIGSVSFVAAAARQSGRHSTRELRALADAAGGRVEFPYVTEVYVSRAV